MSLKIISGAARGVTLETPPDTAMRPTLGRAREALFSSLGPLAEQRFIDAFAGSGAIGLEAASRGAGFVGFIERDRRHAELLSRNLDKVRRAGVTTETVLLTEAVTPEALRRLLPAAVLFGDPPYAEALEHWRKLAEFLAGALAEGAIGRLIFELPDTPGSAGAFLQTAREQGLPGRVRRFGGTDFLWVTAMESAVK